MTRFLLAGAVALGVMTGVAVAQTTTSQTTTTTVPTLVPPPPGTLSTTTTKHSVAADGTRTDATKTVYGNSNGVASDSMTKTTTYPPPAVITTHERTSTSVTQ